MTHTPLARIFIVVCLVACSFAVRAKTDELIVANVHDDPDREWCYLAKSTTVIGVPFVPEPVQVTYDGAIYTRNAELCFFHGEKDTPMMARQKTFLDGWIPIVRYAVDDAGVRYHVEMLSAPIEPLGRDNLVQFVKVTMENISTVTKTGRFASAIRGTGQLNRMGDSRWNMVPEATLSFDSDRFLRDSKTVYLFSEGGRRFATPTTPYTDTFAGGQFGLTDRHVTGLARYSQSLKPGKTYSAVFKLPRQFISDGAELKAVEKARYSTIRKETIDYWKNLIESGTQISIPESRVNDSYKAGLVHLLLATRTHPEHGSRQGSGLPYDDLFLNDYIDMLLAYDTAGLRKYAEPNIDWLLRKQHSSGMFIDVHNRGNDDIVTSHGQGLFSLAYHYVITRDEDYARKVYPAVRKGVELILHDHQTNKYGLLRPSIPYDAPMLTGHHTCHNLFGLTALQASIRMARMMGETTDAEAWTKGHAGYKKAVLKAIDDVVKREGYIASGLYDWSPGWIQGKEGWVNDHPNQDWENNLLVFPSELLSPDDPRVLNTLETIRKRKYREGCMTYRNGMHIHQYVTVNLANQYMAIGQQDRALSDLYHVLLHNGSTHEGFENLVVPWSRLVRASCPPPHAWAAAKTSLFIRNMMVREYGGQGGLVPGERNLYLFSLISPAWVAPGHKVEIKNAVTEMGTVSATMTFKKDGAEIRVKSKFHTPPAQLAITIPDFVTLESCKVDGKTYTVSEEVFFVSAKTKKISLKWTPEKDAHQGTYQNLLKMYRSEYGYVQDAGRFKTEQPPVPVLTEQEQQVPAQPVSFDLVRRAFVHEFNRRLEQHREAGGKVLEIAAPPMIPSVSKETTTE